MEPISSVPGHVYDRDACFELPPEAWYDEHSGPHLQSFASVRGAKMDGKCRDILHSCPSICLSPNQLEEDQVDGRSEDSEAVRFR